MRAPRRSVNAAAAPAAPGFVLPVRVPSSRTTGTTTGTTEVHTGILADFDRPIQRRTAPGSHPPERGTTR